MVMISEEKISFHKKILKMIFIVEGNEEIN